MAKAQKAKADDYRSLDNETLNQKIGDEEMRLVGCASPAIDPRFGGPDASRRMKRERFRAIL